MTRNKSVLGAMVAAALAAACGGSVKQANPVVGTVLSLDGKPLANARVRIGAAPIVTTDAQGSFRVETAPASYDAAVVFDAPYSAAGGPSSISRAVVYLGLSRRDPTLYEPRVRRVPSGGADWHYTGIGSLNVTGMPSGAGPALYTFVDAQGDVSEAGDFSGGPKQFSWFGTTSSTGKLVVLAIDSAGSLVAAGHLALTATSSVISPTVAVAPAANLSVALTSRAAAGCTLRGSVSMAIASAASEGTLFVAGQAASSTLALGYTDEVPLSLRVAARCSDPLAVSFVARRLTPATTSFDLEVPAAPMPTPPAGGAATTATALTWSSPSGTLSDASFASINHDGYTVGTLDIFTSAASTTFPDLTALGALVVPDGSGLSWSQTAYGGLASVDLAADATGLGALFAGTSDFSVGTSSAVSLTVTH